MHFMSGSRRKFSDQFKAEAVQLVLQSGDPIAKVARDLQINEGTLGNWVALWRRDNPEPDPELNPMERARLRELQEQNRKLKMENEFLKKAAAFFAQTHQ
jgi:transposase-like protein